MHPWQKPKKNASALRLVGAQVAMFRKVAGLTQRELAERLIVHEETIASIEQGRRALQPDLATDMDRALDTKGALAVAVEHLPERDKYPVWAAEFITYEREAITLSSYENQVVPGLLQTEDYARATCESNIPLLNEDEIESRVAARIERQAVLRRKAPPSASFIVSEAVLMDRLGGTAVYQEQLHRLRECAALPGVSLQVLPVGRQNHAGLDGPFVLLETTDHDLLAYIEAHRNSHLISNAEEVSVLARKYAMLRTQALNPEDTRSLLDRLLGDA
ncbi:helix-turn-helix domain-containing protein [Streptomyces sp. H39-C1]|uniref:helix-turn-helix domain-containing protein n=1 Tax=Streptomyces sp. H39-C1 TaxID=3004355 RepID=UPI0022AF3323|nr:helix-turn-helix transcriptional regulator [Streptomyces sp. H39-C1]MCZ4097104.1 helix-turn-helix transcriptional regulator [Streptomyces sp. H39-C1]